MTRWFVLTPINEWLLVTLLVLIGGYFRLTHFSGSMAWTNDISRDFLMAHQIATTHVWPTRGHFNTGIKGFYAPYYFDFLGALAILGGSPDFIYVSFIAVHTVMLVGLYLLGKVVFDRQTGLVLLLISVFSRAFIDMAHYPAPATWSLPLNILSLLLVMIWWQQKQEKYLWLGAGISLIALQVHGSQLVWLGIVMALLGWQLWQNRVNGAIATNLVKILMWFASLGVMLLSQKAFFSMLLNPRIHSLNFSLEKLQKILTLIQELLFTDKRAGTVFIVGLSLSTLAWFWQRRNHLAEKLWQSWGLLAAYVLIFELALLGLDTSVLLHHQYYVLPVIILLFSGWVVKGFLPFTPWLNRLSRVGLVVLLLTVTGQLKVSSLMVDGDYVAVGNLYQSMKRAGLPLQTALVVMTDASPNQIGEISSSSELWWFLATDLKRKDFDQVYSPNVTELIVVCDLERSKVNGLDCTSQQVAVIEQKYWLVQLQRTWQFDYRFEVQLYQKF